MSEICLKMSYFLQKIKIKKFYFQLIPRSSFSSFSPVISSFSPDVEAIPQILVFLSAAGAPPPDPWVSPSALQHPWLYARLAIKCYFAQTASQCRRYVGCFFRWTSGRRQLITCFASKKPNKVSSSSSKPSIKAGKRTFWRCLWSGTSFAFSATERQYMHCNVIICASKNKSDKPQGQTTSLTI